MSHPHTDTDHTDGEHAPASPSTAVDDAIAAFSRGDPVLIHDFADREGETDIVYPATAVDAAAVSRLRNDAGGLICVALADSVCAAFGLPFLQDTLDHPAAADHDLAYDERSSFSLTVNHRETFTGITDVDRARTISELGAAAAAVEVDDARDPAEDNARDPAENDAREAAEDNAAGVSDASDAFADSFRVPGHVHLLRAAPDLLADRLGHTELALALAEVAGQPPATVVCEMLDDTTGRARSPADAAAYAARHGLVYVEGSALVDRLG